MGAAASAAASSHIDTPVRHLVDYRGKFDCPVV